MLRKKATQYYNTRRSGFLEGFQGDTDCYDWTGYINKKFSKWYK